MTERRETDRRAKRPSSKPSSSKPSSKTAPADTSERIAKYLARCGVASRREAEALIAAGEVTVDGTVLETPAFKVTGRERITVRGRPVRPPEPTRLWRYHKPSGLVTTNVDPEGRPTVFQHLPGSLPRVISVGRLDLTTEGLLLLTNDGELARTLELPATGLKRVYRARAHGKATPEVLRRLKEGITVDGERYAAIDATLERETGTNAWIRVELAEGKKREVRRALEAVGLIVNRLIRISYGPFVLGDLPAGAVAEVNPYDLQEALGALMPKARRTRSTRSRGPAQDTPIEATTPAPPRRKPQAAKPQAGAKPQGAKPPPRRPDEDERPRRGKPAGGRGKGPPRGKPPAGKGKPRPGGRPHKPSGKPKR